MITKRIAIDGEWYEVNFFLEENKDIRVELMHNIKMKSYKMYPDNKINIKDFKGDKE